MAQVCGGPGFDLASERKHDVAQRILSRAADISAAGKGSLQIDSLLAVLLRIYLSRWTEFGGILRTKIYNLSDYVAAHSIRDEARALEFWLPMVGTPQQEGEDLVPFSKRGILPGLLTSLRVELSRAVDQWKLGDPESPPTLSVLQKIEHLLFKEKLLRRPPNVRV
jgi:hypothetical protein